MNTERRLFVTIIAATAILASAIGAGLAKVGSGFATRAGDGITVTGSAKVTAKADKAVWTLNSQASAPLTISVCNESRRWHRRTEVIP
jgi:hypothetical protein